MNFTDILTSIKPYYRQSQGQLWLLAIVAMAGVLVITTAYSLYDSLSQISFRGGSDQQVAAALNATSESTISQLTQSPLFGASEQAASQHINTTLLLLGVLYSKDQKQAEAIIASQGKEAKVYSVNDELADGGRLRSIYADRVILMREGRLETLYLDWTKRGEKSAAAKAVPGNDNLDNSTQNNTEDVTPTPTASVMPQTSPEVQNPEDWQRRIKEIREKYQNQFAPQEGGVPPGAKFGPMRGFRGRGGM